MTFVRVGVNTITTKPPQEVSNLRLSVLAVALGKAQCMFRSFHNQTLLDTRLHASLVMSTVYNHDSSLIDQYVVHINCLCYTVRTLTHSSIDCTFV